MTLPAADSRIHGLRPSRRYIDPFRAHGTVLETERRPGDKLEHALTVFLAGAECPFACSFCDLWQWTIDGPTPPGAITAQLSHALQSLAEPLPDRIKLYNASNFFDPRAVPTGDLDGLPDLLDSFEAVTVESHASTINRRAVSFSQSIRGRLEVAIGLETIHALALAESNKRLQLSSFDRAVSFLLTHGIDVRVFVLLGMPYVPAEEAVEWTVRSVEYAAQRGATVVSIIPVRAGNGELERLESEGNFTRPTFLQLEQTLLATQKTKSAVVTADLWDVDRLVTCKACRDERIDLLRTANITGKMETRAVCGVCGE